MMEDKIRKEELMRETKAFAELRRHVELRSLLETIQRNTAVCVVMGVILAVLLAAIIWELMVL